MVGRHLVSVGLGNCARALGERLLACGWQVSGTVREADKCIGLQAAGFNCVPFDGSRPSASVSQLLAEASHLLLSAPPGENGDPLLRQHGDDILNSETIRWIGYLSTVGVYGDHGGAWIDEDEPVRPATARGERRVAAEQAWQALALQKGVPLGIFRLAGIYGPGSNQLVSLRAGTAKRIVKPGQLFNRIHLHDIVTVLDAAIARPADGARIYNVCDDEPAPPQDVVAYAAGLLGVEPPAEVAFDDADLSPMARSFYADNKRCRNTRIKEELGVTLAYPTYREGLAALLETL